MRGTRSAAAQNRCVFLLLVVAAFCSLGPMAGGREEACRSLSGIASRQGERMDPVAAFIEQGARAARFVLEWTDPGSELELRLFRPDGSEVPAERRSTGSLTQFYQIPEPPSGQWHMQVSVRRVGAGGTPFHLRALVDNPILSVAAGLARSTARLPESFLIGVRPSMGHAVVGCRVRAEVEKPDGAMDSLAVKDDGSEPDAEAGDGLYQASYLPASEGAYTFTVLVRCESGVAHFRNEGPPGIGPFPALPTLATFERSMRFSGQVAGGPGSTPGGPEQSKGTRPPVSGSDVLAMVGNIPITADQVDRNAGGELNRLRAEEHQLRRRTLEELIGRTVLQQEAARRGVSVVELLRQEIDEPAASGEPVQRRQLQSQRRAEFLGQLRARSDVRILVKPPRVKVEAGDAPSLGPSDAPVTIVEFSEFQCPYCARVAPTLKRLLERYPDKLRLVFRNFPLASHKQAGRAAEAAACANEQGKFWEMHDRLFENQRMLLDSDLKRHALQLGLDLEVFDRCLASRRYFVRWQQDLTDGTGYGVSATPTFFVNGRMISGAQLYETFVEIIEEELALAR